MMSESTAATGNHNQPNLGVENHHSNLTNAGWSYRVNDRGWVIYRHPQSGRWCTLQEAMAQLEAGNIFRVPAGNLEVPKEGDF